MSTTAVGEAIIPTPRIIDEAAEDLLQQVSHLTECAPDNPTQLHIITARGAEYFLDCYTRTILSRQYMKGPFDYAELGAAGMPTLEIGQLYNPTDSYGVGNRIVTLTPWHSNQEPMECGAEDTLTGMRDTHVLARFLLDQAAANTPAYK